jgi:hypothetical protein
MQTRIEILLLVTAMTVMAVKLSALASAFAALLGHQINAPP